jgi:hypothetical protein
MRVVTASAVAMLLCSPAFAALIGPNTQGEATPVLAPQGPSVRIIPDNPKAAPTTGIDVDGHGYVCRTMALRREDGGITKVRRCAD